MKEVLERYKGRVRLVLKHYPYPDRDYARLAAKASLAAGEQGAFWPMHDLLLANQRRLSPQTILGHARTLKLDIGRFQADLDSERLDRPIDEDFRLARSLGLYQTPTFVINGRLLVGERPFEHFQKVIDEELRVTEKRP